MATATKGVVNAMRRVYHPMAPRATASDTNTQSGKSDQSKPRKTKKLNLIRCEPTAGAPGRRPLLFGM
jgi:hypothetical protein